MVGARTYLILCVLVFASLPLRSQNYPLSDTLTEYPQKGTYYHDRFEGRKTANGEVFNQNLFTAAHWKIKLGTLVMVTNQNTGLQVIVKVNDRCPRHGVMDMTHRAANAIGIRGCQPVTIRILPEDYADRWAAQDALFDSVFSRMPPEPPAMPVRAEPPQTTYTQHSSTESYNIELCTVATHSQAFLNLQQLPVSYQGKVSIEPLVESDSLRLVLEVEQDKRKAEHLQQTLRNAFPHSRVIPAE